jgi:cyclophilin family peptidyl-prolyl cis-trans isomerase
MVAYLFGGLNVAQRPLIEDLEDRTLLTAAPIVTGVVADNRGEVTITLSRTVTGVSKSSVKLFTVGADGVIGDADDVRQPSQVVYNPATGKITIKGKLAADAGYRVRLQSSLIASLDGRHLDGEYTGTLPSGDGHPGGNFSFQVKNDKSNAPTARMSTSEGTIDLTLLKDKAPLNVANFESYVNSGKYDDIWVTRAVAGFVIQMGGLNISPAHNTLGDVADNPAVNGEPGVSNTRGTVALALSQGPNSGTDEFFFNLGDNSSALDGQNDGGPFTVFAQVKNASGLAVMDAIGGLPTANLYNPVTGHGEGVVTQSTDQSDVPIATDTAHLTTTNEQLDTGSNGPVVTGGLNPNADLVVIRRVAVLDKIAPVA